MFVTARLMGFTGIAAPLGLWPSVAQNAVCIAHKKYPHKEGKGRLMMRTPGKRIRVHRPRQAGQQVVWRMELKSGLRKIVNGCSCSAYGSFFHINPYPALPA